MSSGEPDSARYKYMMAATRYEGTMENNANINAYLTNI